MREKSFEEIKKEVIEALQEVLMPELRELKAQIIRISTNLKALNDRLGRRYTRNN